MTPTIRVDDEVFKELGKKAREIDKQFPSPNDVLRSLLGLKHKEKSSQKQKRPQTESGLRKRRPSGRLETR